MTEETLFHAALAKSPAQRAAFLDAACAGQPELRAQVEALLQAHEASGGFLDQPVVPPSEITGAYTPMPNGGGERATIPPRNGTSVNAQAIEPGSVIADRYTLVERIGEGGMGEVWVAKQTEPVKRKVALKLIKAGMDSKDVLNRFEAERQALAMMDHPNIARVLDGGMTPTRQPFFVMELVNGLSLTKFCDDAKMSLRERLELFVPICQAVQHAHQKGIIHRDLKPSNILVTIIDGIPVPKVIDFGVAKAIGGNITDQSLSTQFGAVVGTLEYMSPEQAGHSGVDIDTRADIYSLGVLLYELLTGLRPIDAARLKKAAIFDMIRVIVEDEPSKPSTRLSTDASLASMAALRQIEPKKLMALLRGELDWVVMKCLEKQRDRRYETANGLARDIQRYLADEPVEARPPSASYRFQKFVARNKGQVVAASLVLLALLAGMAGTAWQAIRAENARAAETQRTEGERLAKEKAQKREAETKAVLDFVENRIFAAARPKDQEGGQGYEVKLADAITSALPYVEKSFTDQPLIEAHLRGTLGLSFWYLGKADLAEQQHRRARDLYSAKLGPDHHDTLNCMHNLAVSYNVLGRHPEALALFEQAFKLKKAKLGPDHHDTLRTMTSLANLYATVGRHPEALALREETLKLMQAKLGPDHHDTLNSMTNLANSYADINRHPESLALREETLTLKKAKLGTDHPDTLRCMDNIASSYYRLGRHPEALALGEETLKRWKAMVGPDHPETLHCLHNLGLTYVALGRIQEAKALFEDAFTRRKTKLGPDHPDTLRIMNDLATCNSFLGRHAEVLALREEAYRLQKAKYGTDHAATFQSMNAVADSYSTLGRHAEATTLLEEAVKLQKAKLGPEHPDTLRSSTYLATSYAALSRHPEALALREETLKLQKAKLGSDHTDTLGSMVNLAQSYQVLGRLADAIKLQEETLAIMKAKIPDHRFTFNCMNNLASSYAALGRLAEALALHEETLKLRKAKFGAKHPGTVATLYGIARVQALMIAKAEDRGRQADLAMDWLQQAVAAGYKDVAHMKKDTDLDPLREREDFKKLLAELEVQARKSLEPTPKPSK